MTIEAQIIKHLDITHATKDEKGQDYDPKSEGMRFRKIVLKAARMVDAGEVDLATLKSDRKEAIEDGDTTTADALEMVIRWLENRLQKLGQN